MSVLNDTIQIGTRDISKESFRGNLAIRGLLPNDIDSINQILDNIPQFTCEERQCAIELADLYIKQGEKSGYDFFVATNKDGIFLGYICFGQIPLTDACYDIYWIVVNLSHHGKGIGTELSHAAENKLTNMGARKIFVETSGQAHYVPAQRFYQKMDFRLISRTKDFYKPGDDKLVFVKDLKGGNKDGR